MQVQRVSEYGSRTPWVTRIGIQGPTIIAFCNVEDHIKLDATAALMKLVERLVPLQRARDQLEVAVSAAFAKYAEAGPEFDWGKPGTFIPSVSDLLSLGEGFLQSAKIAIAATTDVVSVFYPATFNHRFDKMVKWSEATFGADDAFTENARICNAFVKDFLKLRDAVEHPSFGKFFVSNIQVVLHEGKWLFGRPGWGIQDVSHTDMLVDMDSIIENIVGISEILVIELFFKFKSDFPMHIEEIPEEDRDPDKPVRFRVVPSLSPTGPGA